MLEALSIPSLTGVSCALDKGDSFYSACFMICMTDSSFFSRINFMRLRKKYAWRNCHAESKKGPVTDSCIPLFPSNTTSSTPFSPPPSYHQGMISPLHPVMMQALIHMMLICSQRPVIQQHSSRSLWRHPVYMIPV